MKKLITALSIITLVFSVALTGCKKDSGPKGDKGDKGDTGVQGVAGTNGTNGSNGTNGTNGVANIQTFTLNVASWTSNTTEWDASFVLAAITPSVLNGGTVQAFQILSGAYLAMPNSVYGIEYNFFYQNSFITFSATQYNGSLPTNPGATSFKVVIIPPAYKVKYPNVNWRNYDEIQKILALED